MNDDTPYDIEISNPQLYDCVNEVLLQRCIGEALRRARTTRARISLAVVGDPHIAELHARYLDIAEPTDVLSFDLGHHDSAADREVVGEIVVSADTALRQARRRGHAADAELALYAVHGTLHLLGFDDATDQQATEMHRLEDHILTSVGVGPVYGDGPDARDRDPNAD